MNHYRIYTTSALARRLAVSEGYTPEGIACLALATGCEGAPDAAPVYRIRRNYPISGFFQNLRLPPPPRFQTVLNQYVDFDGVPFHDHFYTADAREAEQVLAQDPVHNEFQGVGFYVYTAPGIGRTGLYRAFSAVNFRLYQDHLYTTSLGFGPSGSSGEITAVTSFGFENSAHGYALEQPLGLVTIGGSVTEIPLFRCRGVPPSSAGITLPVEGYATTDATATPGYAATGDHFYTTDRQEMIDFTTRRSATGPGRGYQLESGNNVAHASPYTGAVPQYTVPAPAPDRAPLFSLVELTTGNRIYTTDANLCRDRLQKVDRYGKALYAFKGVVAHLYTGPDPGRPGARQPLHAIVFPRAGDVHLYTIFDEERRRAIASGGVDTGLPLGFVPTAPGLETTPLYQLRAEPRRLAVEQALGPALSRRAPNAGNLLLTGRPASRVMSFSRLPADNLLASRERGYTDVLIERAVPLLDRDLNLLGDLAASSLHQALELHLGNGALATKEQPRGGFAVRAVAPLAPADAKNEGDFAILAGKIFAFGVVIDNPRDVTYRTQTIPPGATEPLPGPLTVPEPPREDEREERLDLVYLDVWLDEILGDPNAVGPDSDFTFPPTTALVVPSWLVRVAEGGEIPPEPRGHRYHPLAAVLRPRRGRDRGVITSEQIEDLRGRVPSLEEVSSRLELLQTLRPSVSFPKLAFRGSTIVLQGGNLDLGHLSVRFGGVPASFLRVTGGVFPSSGGYDPRWELSIGVPDSLPQGMTELVIDNGFGAVRAPVDIRADPTITGIAALHESAVITGVNIDSAYQVVFDPRDPALQNYVIDIGNILVRSSTELQVFYDLPAGDYMVTVYTHTGSSIYPAPATPPTYVNVPPRIVARFRVAYERPLAVSPPVAQTPRDPRSSPEVQFEERFGNDMWLRNTSIAFTESDLLDGGINAKLASLGLNISQVSSVVIKDLTLSIAEGGRTANVGWEYNYGFKYFSRLYFVGPSAITCSYYSSSYTVPGNHDGTFDFLTAQFPVLDANAPHGQPGSTTLTRIARGKGMIAIGRNGAAYLMDTQQVPAGVASFTVNVVGADLRYVEASTGNTHLASLTIYLAPPGTDVNTRPQNITNVTVRMELEVTVVG